MITFYCKQKRIFTGSNPYRTKISTRLIQECSAFLTVKNSSYGCVLLQRCVCFEIFFFLQRVHANLEHCRKWWSKEKLDTTGVERMCTNLRQRVRYQCTFVPSKQAICSFSRKEKEEKEKRNDRTFFSKQSIDLFVSRKFKNSVLHRDGESACNYITNL